MNVSDLWGFPVWLFQPHNLKTGPLLLGQPPRRTRILSLAPSPTPVSFDSGGLSIHLRLFKSLRNAHRANRLVPDRTRRFHFANAAPWQLSL